MQQEKLKEEKARLNFEGCSGRNSRIQEVSQHSVSRTPNVRGEHRRGRRSSRSLACPEALNEPVSFPGCDVIGQNSLGTDRQGKTEETKEYSIGWGQGKECVRTFGKPLPELPI
ncbi:hypothetical protein Tco_0275619 [Tanacetum coccineum]